jgi:hypothetical protein
MIRLAARTCLACAAAQRLLLMPPGLPFRRVVLAASICFLASLPVAAADAAAGWVTLFDGKTLAGWKANTLPDSFSVVDGTIKAHAAGESSHLFFVGDDGPEKARFKNFELELMARSEPGSNSGIFFHSEIHSGDGRRKSHLSKGYEVQLNSSTIEKRKTGSLYDVVDLAESPVNEADWFKVRVRVEGRRIVVQLNDRTVVDYTEPENVERPPARAGRRLDPQGGWIALQGHDPKSVFYFKEIRIRRLP